MRTRTRAHSERPNGWLTRFRAGVLAALARQPRVDRGQRKLPAELQRLIEGKALRRPAPPVAGIHRQAARRPVGSLTVHDDG